MSKTTETATWVGPYGYRLPDGTLLETGVTVCEISAGEAEASDYWQPIKAAAPKTKGDD